MYHLLVKPEVLQKKHHVHHSLAQAHARFRATTRVIVHINKK